ncbi:MAG TPA: hypothetical protein VN841_29190 [Bryobacteraceae bacterium]|nr:hypothetical protein [Bryobacteraceae bacterium]
MKPIVRILTFAAAAACLFAQGSDKSGAHDQASVVVTRAAHPLMIQPAPGRPMAVKITPWRKWWNFKRPAKGATAPVAASTGLEQSEALWALTHPVHVEARHPVPGCLKTEECGELFFSGETHNMRTSAGTTWQSQLMGDTSTPAVNNQCNNIALTNTAFTPAEADTTLSGEITTNGLARAQATYTDASTTLSVPAAPTASVLGTAGSTSYWYWVAACNQGICTTPSAASNNITTANATLSATNFNTITWTGQNGASTYQVYRTTSSTAPSGTVTDQVQGNPDCSAALACEQDDESNTLLSVTIPGSNLTNFGKFTLVHTWTATASQSAQAFGVLTASSSGTMCFEGTFTPVSLNNGDTFQLTETVYF